MHRPKSPDRFLLTRRRVYTGMDITLNDAARGVLDGPHIAAIATSNADDPEKRLLYEMYDRYMSGMAPPPEADAERLIVRITPEKVHQFPPAAE
jgi:hypothetical protein